MRLVVVVFAASLLAGCGKKQSEDKAPPASTEPATGGAPNPAPVPARGSAPGSVDPMTEPDTDIRGGTPADEGGELERKMKTPADDGGEDKKPVPADDGGEAVQRACAKSGDCPATFDCCNAFCVKQGTAKHALECKLPEGNL